MEMISGKELGHGLCEIFEQPHDRIQEITVMANADGLASVMISRLITDEETQEIYTLFEYFNLIKTGEHKQLHPQGFV